MSWVSDINQNQINDFIDFTQIYIFIDIESNRLIEAKIKTVEYLLVFFLSAILAMPGYWTFSMSTDKFKVVCFAIYDMLEKHFKFALYAWNGTIALFWFSLLHIWDNFFFFLHSKFYESLPSALLYKFVYLFS